MDIELSQHITAIARWLLNARGHMSREKAAQLLGVSAKTLQRAESGETTPQGDLLLRAAAVYGRSLSELDGFVQVAAKRVMSPGVKYTVESYGYPREIDQRLRAFERDLLRNGASDREVDLVTSIIRDPTTVQFIQVDDRGYPRDLREMTVETEILIRALSIWIDKRREHRAEAGPEPIKPKDLPAEVEKRKAELAADKTTSKPSRRTK